MLLASRYFVWVGHVGSHDARGYTILATTKYDFERLGFCCSSEHRSWVAPTIFEHLRGDATGTHLHHSSATMHAKPRAIWKPYAYHIPHMMSSCGWRNDNVITPAIREFTVSISSSSSFFIPCGLAYCFTADVVLATCG